MSAGFRSETLERVTVRVSVFAPNATINVPWDWIIYVMWWNVPWRCSLHKLTNEQDTEVLLMDSLITFSDSRYTVGEMMMIVGSTVVAATAI